MKFATYNGESTLEQLGQRLFGDAAKPALLQELVARNPQLENLSSLPRGTLIVIDDDAPFLATQERTTGTIIRTLAAIDDLERQRNEAADRRVADVKRNVELANLQALREAVRAKPDLLGKLDDLIRKAPEREQEIAAERKDVADALRRARAAARNAGTRRRAVRS